MKRKDRPDYHSLKLAPGDASSMLLKYQGAVTTEVIDSLLSLVQHRLESDEPNISLQKKVYSVLMECIQNIRLHVDLERDQEFASGYISLERKAGNYEIITANFVSRQSVSTLKNIIENINSKTAPGALKDLYNEVIVNRIFGARGGGGLGLIDIARKTGKLNYALDDVNEDYSLFTFSVSIKG